MRKPKLALTERTRGESLRLHGRQGEMPKQPPVAPAPAPAPANMRYILATVNNCDHMRAHELSQTAQLSFPQIPDP